MAPKLYRMGSPGNKPQTQRFHMEMKRIGLVLICLWGCGTCPAMAGWEEDYASLLKKYAGPSGVRYASWKQHTDDLEKLARITQTIQNRPLTGKKIPEEKAFLINAYNIWVLKGVLDAHPILSVLDTAPNFGFFSENRLMLNGKKTSLNDLEKNLLLKTFRDPRIHFALNCASRSCPPLSSEPFRASKIDVQLDAVTRTFLDANPEAVRLSPDGRELRISSLFDWYAGDFEPSGGVTAFINKYRRNPLPPSLKPGFLPYMWNLNEIP